MVQGGEPFGWAQGGPFDEACPELSRGAQGKRRVESPMLHFEFRNSNFENRERVER